MVIQDRQLRWCVKSCIDEISFPCHVMYASLCMGAVKSGHTSINSVGSKKDELLNQFE